MLRHKFLFVFVIGLIALFAVNTTAQACTCPKGQHAEHGKCVPDHPTPTPPPVQTPIVPPSAPQQDSAKPGWAACDWNIKDVPAEQMTDWQYRCKKAATATPKPKAWDGCTNEAILTEFLAFNKKGVAKWDIRWFRSAKTGLEVVVDNMTKNFEGNFRNPTIAHDVCKFAVDVSLPDGRHEVRIYNFGMTLLGRITDVGESYIQPEFGKDGRLIVVRASDHAIIETNTRRSVWHILPIKGTQPNSIDSTMGLTLTYIDKDGYLSMYIVGPVGSMSIDKPRSLAVQCDYPKWSPAGDGFVFCRNGSLNKQPTSVSARSLKMSTRSTTSLDPSGSGRAVTSDIYGLRYYPEIGQSSSVLVNDQFGLGSDWENGSEPELGMVELNALPDGLEF